MLAAKKVVKQAENSLAQAKEYLARTELQLVEAIHENDDFDKLSEQMDDMDDVIQPKAQKKY